jgi:hypothetical protein
MAGFAAGRCHLELVQSVDAQVEGRPNMVPRARYPGILIAAASIATVSWGQAAVHRSIEQKFAIISEDRAAAGASFHITAAELTGYARRQAAEIAPGAVTGAAISISPEHAEATGSINFLRLRGTDQPDGFLDKLLDGERPIRVRVRIQSANGYARVDVERAEISGVAIEGPALDFLIREFVLPNFPDARVGEWFKLRHRIDRFTLTPGAADIFIRAAER